MEMLAFGFSLIALQTMDAAVVPNNDVIAEDTITSMTTKTITAKSNNDTKNYGMVRVKSIARDKHPIR